MTYDILDKNLPRRWYCISGKCGAAGDVQWVARREGNVCWSCGEPGTNERVTR